MDIDALNTVSVVAGRSVEFTGTETILNQIAADQFGIAPDCRSNTVFKRRKGPL